MNKNIICSDKVNDHVQWLADWHTAREAIENAPYDCDADAVEMQTQEAMSTLLATIPAASKHDLLAQIEWFKEELGEYVFGNASPAHDMIFDTLKKGVENVKS